MVQGLSILVVDDDRSVLGTVAEVVETEGHRCWQATCAEQALEIAANRPIEASILDMHLGETTGLEILLRLRRLHGLLPAVLMSGALTAEIRLEAERLGVCRVLDKPLDLAHLRSAVHQLV